MTPEDITLADVVKTVVGMGVTFIVYLVKREIDRVGVELANKADKEHMQRELSELKMELKETREAKERDMERLERANAERFAEFNASIRDRITTMERNFDSKLDMIMDMIGRLRKE